ncbi:MAG: hypothetical protein KAY32_11425 [Candidatus Eisenbacteria sp.]|nr:hypothetical protein [Candidatus Eisenbacteria bacterium]
MKRFSLIALALLLSVGVAMADKEKFDGSIPDASEGLLDCSNAFLIDCGGSHAYNNGNGTDVVASYNCVSWSLNGPEVVYEFTLTEDLYVTIDLTFSLKDLALLLLEDCDETLCLSYSDNYGDGVAEQIALDLAAATYIIVVEGWMDDDIDDYTLTVTCSAPPEPPVNDQCDGAILIERCTTGLIEGDLAEAVDDYNPGEYPESCTGFSAHGKDVTYELNLLAGDIVHLSYADAAGASFDESLYIVTDCSDPENTCVIGSDAGEPEVIDWTCDADGTYYVICDAWGTDTGGAFTLDYDIECPVTPTDESTWSTVKGMFY